MKTAIYIEDGLVQLVITLESDFEKNALKSFGEEGIDAQIFRGSFYDCRGGWVRQNEHYSQFHGIDSSEDNSLIIKVKNNEQD